MNEEESTLDQAQEYARRGKALNELIDFCRERNRIHTNRLVEKVAFGTDTNVYLIGSFDRIDLLRLIESMHLIEEKRRELGI